MIPQHTTNSHKVRLSNMPQQTPRSLPGYKSNVNTLINWIVSTLSNTWLTTKRTHLGNSMSHRKYTKDKKTKVCQQDLCVQTIASAQQSYFKDSFALKEIISKLHLPPNMLLFTCDAKSMYTNIPTEITLTVISNYITTEDKKLFHHYNS